MFGKKSNSTSMTKRNSSKATITIKSPAKINLTLNVVSKRKDGYHNLETIMIPVSLWDEMEILTTNSKKIKIICDNKELPVDDDNIINRAIRLLWDVTGLKIGVLVKLKKNIPVAAGLGGGSTNGASVLLALNKLWKTGLTISRLTEIGKKLGADVPFFVH